MYPPLHILIYGQAHVGKSTFARTMPPPNLVFMFDPQGKDSPYTECGEIHDQPPNEFGTPIRHIVNNNQLIHQIEYYQEAFPETPTAYKRFLNRMQRIHEEYNRWSTIIVDSVTFLEMHIRLYEKYVLNPNAKDKRQYYNAAKDSLEENLMIRFGAFPMNVCVIAHEKIDKVELTQEVIRGVNVVGQLSSRMGAGFSELYRMKIIQEGSEFKRVLQTQPDILWPQASSRAIMQTPNPCNPTYQDLWVNFKP